MNTAKRLLSAVLCLILLISSVPFSLTANADFAITVYDWDAIAISAENNPAIRIVTWGMDSQLNGKDYKAGTTLQIAQNKTLTFSN